ncbi:MAG: hypothetical protein DLM50_08415 [Candidatus Meridianibacter frigidus]|nr:MAG: hypothetical protein DLM50_08415 [Candidatus Eremiobacteraeota bacterium]
MAARLSDQGRYAFGSFIFYTTTSVILTSAAYHTKFGPFELYAAFGNANATNTAHDFLIKLIKYIDNEKGT